MTFTKQVFNTGTLLGLLVFVNAMVLYFFLTQNPFTSTGVTGHFLYVFGLYFGSKHLKKDFSDRFVNYRSSFTSILKISMVFSSFYGALLYLFEKLGDFKLLQRTKHELKDSYELVSQDLSAWQQQMFNGGYETMSLGSLCISEVISKFFLGLIISLILANILKHKPSF